MSHIGIIEFVCALAAVLTAMCWMMVTKTAGFQHCPLYLKLCKARLNRVQLFSRTWFRHLRRTRLEGRVFLPAQRWCLELGRTSGGMAGADPQLRSRCRGRIGAVT